MSNAGQVNELANNTVSEMVREVNVCLSSLFFFFKIIEEHWKVKTIFKCAAVLLCGSLLFLWHGIGCSGWLEIFILDWRNLLELGQRVMSSSKWLKVKLCLNDSFTDI